MSGQTQYLSQEKFNALSEERRVLKEETIPDLAQRIDDARQLGDLSENAEYHAAREDMAWAQSRVKEIDHILDNAEMINGSKGTSDTVMVGSVVAIKMNGSKREYTIVGAQEADPLSGKISNESPLGSAFLGHKKGDKVHVKAPAGVQVYEILSIT